MCLRARLSRHILAFLLALAFLVQVGLSVDLLSASHLICCLSYSHFVCILTDSIARVFLTISAVWFLRLRGR